MRPIRSLLYVPANRQEWVVSAPTDYDADGLIFDLEDAVPVDHKEDARQILADAIPEYQNPEPAITIRVNSPDSGLFEEDLKAVVQSGLDAIVLPKISAVDDIRRADHLLTYLETIRDLDSHIEIVAHPETAQGLRQAHDLCSISDRVTMLVGATSKGADIERALGFDWTPEGREKQYMLSKLAMDGRAAGLNQLCAGPWLDVDNISGLRAEARMARQFGYTGYQLIHPSHIEPVNQIFTPDPEEIEQCQSLLEAIDESETTKGRGTLRHEGEMIDLAHIRRAKDLIDRAKAFGIDP